MVPFNAQASTTKDSLMREKIEYIHITRVSDGRETFRIKTQTPKENLCFLFLTMVKNRQPCRNIGEQRSRL